MMETMTKIHVSDSILCLQKLPLLSWLGKPLAAEQWECCDLRGQGRTRLLLSSLGLAFFICTPGSRTLLCSCKIQIRVKVRTTCVQVKHHPWLIINIINRGRRVILWLSHSTRQKSTKGGNFYHTRALR